MLCLYTIAAVPAGIFLVISINDLRSNRSIPSTPLAVGWLVAAGGVAALVLFIARPWRWESIFDVANSLIPLGVGGGLLYVYIQRLVWAVRLDRSTTTRKVSRMKLESATPDGASFLHYEYGDGLKGKAPSTNRLNYAREVAILPGRPTVHRLLPGVVPEAAQRENRRAALFVLGLIGWMAVLLVLAIWQGLNTQSASLIFLAGIVVWLAVWLTPLFGRPARVEGEKQAPRQHTIPANADALAAELRGIGNSGTRQFVIFTDRASGRFVQFLGLNGSGSEMVVDVPLCGLSADQAERLRACFESLDVEPVAGRSADSLMGSFEADAGRAARIGLALLVGGLGAEAGSALVVESGEVG